MTVTLAERHPYAWWLRRLYRLPWGLPLVALWLLIAVRGHWYFWFLPDVVGYHWMVPQGALLTAIWVGSLLNAGDEVPWLRPCTVQVGEHELVVGGEAFAWREVQGVGLVRGKTPRLALDTARGARALYSPSGVGELERLAAALHARVPTR